MPLERLSVFFVFAKRISVLFIVYFLLRLYFLYNNWSYFEGSTAQDITGALVHGFRFDLYSVLLINIIFFVFMSISLSKYKKLNHFLFVLLNSIFLMPTFIDLEFFQFSGQRITQSFFDLGQDIVDHSFHIAYDYWFNTLLFTVTIYGIYKWDQLVFYTKRFSSPVCSLSKAALTFTLVAIMIIGIRGGLQDKPLSLSHAFTHSNGALGYLSLNSCFTLIRGKKHRSLPQFNFFNSTQHAKDYLLSKKQFSPKVEELKKKLRGHNVVIIILESFALDYTGHINQENSYTPFYDSLGEKGVFFPNFFANGRLSIEALPPIFCGIPNLLDSPFIRSAYQGANIHCLPKLFQEIGYSTHFFHGAKNGSMHFDKFGTRAGFQHYNGLNEYPDSNDSDGFWGIYDEPYLKHFKNSLSKVTQPFFASVFTLSSHHPYNVPTKYKDKFKGGEIEILKSIEYTDYALNEFFTEAAKTAWFNNTLFLLTADHTQKILSPHFSSDISRHRIPLVAYHPSIDLNQFIQNPERTSQHIDVYATLFDYFLSAQNFVQAPFGSPLSNTDSGVVVNKGNGSYWLATNKNQVFRRNADASWEHLVFSDSSPLKSISKNSAQFINEQKLLEAYLQLFFSKLKTNQLYE